MGKEIKVGSDFSGVGAFNQSLNRLGVKYKEIFACEKDKYARKTYILNYGEPEYFPNDVYKRKIPKESLDIYMTSPPCQSFSMAGNRLGKLDKRGILFFNSLEFIRENNQRYFIFENVKGLLSIDNGKTFNEWINYLGGKSVNGNHVIFTYQNSVNYHIYWQVINSKNHNVPQNRERIFIVGIRDDIDNVFSFPKDEKPQKRIKDILESNVDEKYFLSDKIIAGFNKHNEHHKKKGTGFIWKPKTENDIASCIRANASLSATDNSIKIGVFRLFKEDYGFREMKNNVSPTILARCRNDGAGIPVISERLMETLKVNEIKENRIVDAYNKTIKNIIHTINSSIDKSRHIHLITKENETYRIRRLTPRECFRLMDFPDTFIWDVSDSQAYKQAGNSIVVKVLYKIISNLNL